ncbi:MAG TPA: hypothetical protein DDW36_02375 [Candidatus Magasanikbacteria bacterium]|nr:hypothetical protein [Candidatus Magasanikbacteria bacterium]
MRHEHLKHILELVARTGDRMVIVDESFRIPFVVMDIESYEMLLDAFDDAQRESQLSFGHQEKEFGLNKPKNDEEISPFDLADEYNSGHLTTQDPSDILEPAADEAPMYVPISESAPHQEVPATEIAPPDLVTQARPIPRIGSAESVVAQAAVDSSTPVQKESAPEFLPEPEGI